MNLAVVVLVLLTPFATVAQENSALVSKIEAVRFAPLARQARIQGDVRLRFGPKGVTVLSGNPLLVQTAVDSVKGLGTISSLEVEAIYHFVFVENAGTQITKRIEKRGNRFERVFLHALMMKTERVVEYQECVENPPPKNKIELSENRVEVWIYGSAVCLQIQASQMALR